MAEESRTTQLRVGRLTKAHGLKGAIKVELYTDEPEKRFVPGATFILQVPETSPWFGKTLELNELRWYNSMPVAFFTGIEDRTTAETILKAILLVEQDEKATPDDPDAWFDHQLAGLRVERDGVEIGTVVRVDHMPAQDLLVVKTSPASGAGAEVLVPFVKAIVPEVDVEKGVVTITPPGGLFEELEEVEELEESEAADESKDAPHAD